MRFRFQFRRYRLPFRAGVRTAHGVWTERAGVLVRLEEYAPDGRPRAQPEGAAGFGEAAPIPWFGTETADEVEEACRAMGEWIESDAPEAMPAAARCATLANALAAAHRRKRREGAGAGEEITLGVAALLPAGRGAIPAIGPKLEIGYRVFKWKVGVADLADELALLDDLCAELPTGAKLRLDANGAWTRPQATRWLERCAERPIEFVEQPCFADASQGETAQRRADDLLSGLADDYPTPLALDESLVGDRDLERWLGAGWRGVFVVKPSLLADAAGAMARLEKAKASVVFSSALETAVGAQAALRAAFGWKGERRALGFGVWPLFADARFDGPAAAPFLRASDVERIDAEALWNALG